MKTITKPFTYKKIALSLLCFSWALSQGVLAQSPAGVQLFEGLEQYPIGEVELVLEERLEDWLLRFKDKPALLAASTGPLLNALEGQGYFKAAAFLSERLLGNDRCDFDSRLQKKLAEQDISLLSISLDREEATFRKTASQYLWAHYSDFQGWDSPAVKAYHVFATPSFFLINAKGVLEKEFISVEQIRDFSTTPPYGRPPSASFDILRQAQDRRLRTGGSGQGSK